MRTETGEFVEIRLPGATNCRSAPLHPGRDDFACADHHDLLALAIGNLAESGHSVIAENSRPWVGAGQLRSDLVATFFNARHSGKVRRPQWRTMTIPGGARVCG